MTAEQFVAAGADELQHLNFVFLNFLAKEAPDTRDMTRFTAIGRFAHAIDPEGEREQILEIIEALPKEMALVLIEHDMDLVFRFAKTISVLVQGALFVEGPEIGRAHV